MTRTISAIYENGAFRPTEAVTGLPEHAPVRLTIEEGSVAPPGKKRVLGLQRGSVLYISSDFDDELGDGFWFGSKA